MDRAFSFFGGNMRDWLNAILGFIGTTSLTDEEYAGMNLLNVETQIYSQAAYDALSAVLLGRENVSQMQARLVGVFKAKGTEVNPADTAKTNILLGIPL